MAVAAKEMPMATAKMSDMTDSVRPTTAMASRPRRATQKMSTTVNSDSMSISRIMGTARSRTARLSGSAV